MTDEAVCETVQVKVYVFFIYCENVVGRRSHVPLLCGIQRLHQASWRGPKIALQIYSSQGPHGLWCSNQCFAVDRLILSINSAFAILLEVKIPKRISLWLAQIHHAFVITLPLAKKVSRLTAVKYRRSTWEGKRLSEWEVFPLTQSHPEIYSHG